MLMNEACSVIGINFVEWKTSTVMITVFYRMNILLTYYKNSVTVNNMTVFRELLLCCWSAGNSCLRSVPYVTNTSRTTEVLVLFIHLFMITVVCTATYIQAFTHSDIQTCILRITHALLSQKIIRKSTLHLLHIQTIAVYEFEYLPSANQIHLSWAS
jgi:hypothetical protein